MFKKKENRPVPGNLFYPASGGHPGLRSSWYLTVNERYPEDHSLGEQLTREICNRIWNHSIQDNHSTIRSWLIAFDSQGDYLEPEDLSDEAKSRIEDSILDGRYHGRIGRKDIVRGVNSGPRTDVFRCDNRKPRVKFTGEDGNIFNLIGIATKALKRNGQADRAEEMQNRIYNDARDYDHAIRIIMEYVEAE